MDIINSIHSFNSLKISKNYFFIFMTVIVLKNYFYIKNCFLFNIWKKNHKIKLNNFIILFIINIFIFYINHNIYTTYFLNKQFVETTKYIKNLINLNIIFII